MFDCRSGKTGAFLEKLHNKVVNDYMTILGKKKNVEALTDGRADALSDAERAAAAQIVILGEGIRNPFSDSPEASTILKSRLYSLDRVSVIIDPEKKQYRILPKNYSSDDGFIKYRGKTPLGFISKHDICISGTGDMIGLITVLGDKKMPAEICLKLKVRTSQFKI
jgi:hypothetical protein